MGLLLAVVTAISFALTAAHPATAPPDQAALHQSYAQLNSVDVESASLDMLTIFEIDVGNERVVYAVVSGVGDEPEAVPLCGDALTLMWTDYCRYYRVGGCGDDRATFEDA